MLKAPGTEHLKPQYDEPPTTFALKFKLRRYTMGWLDQLLAIEVPATLAQALQVRLAAWHVT
jgi:hypothetical protein